MYRSKLTLTALLMMALLIGWTAHGPAKDKKDPPPIKLPEPDTLKDDLRVVNENGFKGEWARPRRVLSTKRRSNSRN